MIEASKYRELNSKKIHYTDIPLNLAEGMVDNFILKLEKDSNVLNSSITRNINHSDEEITITWRSKDIIINPNNYEIPYSTDNQKPKDIGISTDSKPSQPITGCPRLIVNDIDDKAFVLVTREVARAIYDNNNQDADILVTTYTDGISVKLAYAYDSELKDMSNDEYTQFYVEIGS